VEALLALCGAAGGWDACVIAIDAPLAWPRAFEALLAGTPLDSVAADSSANAYLLRECERRLIKRGLRPMSPIVQQIGSQAVKGQHFLARAGLELTRPGVWTPADGRVLAIEAYPSAARRSAVALGRYREVFGAVYERTAGERGQGADVKDARLCAVTALLLEQEPEVLAAPSGDAPRSEGWVWVPKDALARNLPPNQP
jgi:predicted nuclease with RNAse H fold